MILANHHIRYYYLHYCFVNNYINKLKFDPPQTKKQSMIVNMLEM